MNQTTALTLADITALFGFGCLIGSICFAIATKLKEAAIDKINAQMIQDVNDIIENFRRETKADLHYFREETDSGVQRFEERTLKTLSNYRVKAGTREVRITNIENFLSARFGFQIRLQVDESNLPTDFTNSNK